MNWQDIETNTNYINAPAEKKRAIADRFYNEKLVTRPEFSSFDDSKKQSIKTRFYERAGFPLDSTPEQQFPVVHKFNPIPSPMELISHPIDAITNLRNEYSESQEAFKQEAPIAKQIYQPNALSRAVGGTISDVGYTVGKMTPDFSNSAVAIPQNVAYAVGNVASAGLNAVGDMVSNFGALDWGMVLEAPLAIGVKKLMSKVPALTEDQAITAMNGIRGKYLNEYLVLKRQVTNEKTAVTKAANLAKLNGDIEAYVGALEGTPEGGFKIPMAEGVTEPKPLSPERGDLVSGSILDKDNPFTIGNQLQSNRDIEIAGEKNRLNRKAKDISKKITIEQNRIQNSPVTNGEPITRTSIMRDIKAPPSKLESLRNQYQDVKTKLDTLNKTNGISGDRVDAELTKHKFPAYQEERISEPVRIAPEELHDSTAIPAEPVETIKLPPALDSMVKEPPVKTGSVSASQEDRLVVYNDLEKQTAGMPDNPDAVRQAAIGDKNAQLTRVRHLTDEINRLVPSRLTQMALKDVQEANWDRETILKWYLDPKYSDKVDTLKEALRIIDTPTPNENKVMKLAHQYYNEQGAESIRLGTIEQLRANYQQRGKWTPPQENANQITPKSPQGLNQYTYHSKARAFETIDEGIQAGWKHSDDKTIAESISDNNRQMTLVNSSRNLTKYLESRGNGEWTTAKKMRPDWEQVGNIEANMPVINKTTGKILVDEEGNNVYQRQIFTAPKEFAKGLKVLADPDFLSKVGWIKSGLKYQGLVKTVKLAWSLFHHKALISQALYDGQLGMVKDIMNGSFVKSLETKGFKDMAIAHAQAGGMTTSIEPNRDVITNILKKDGTVYSKIVNMPGVKQLLSRTDKNSQFLFDKLQRYEKVVQWSKQVTTWIADHPNATDNEITLAKREIARHGNTIYGGLNWEAKNVSKSTLTALRAFLLAPDWFVSNVDLVREGLALNMSPSSMLGKKHIATALLGGEVLLQVLNKTMTGHYAYENKKGHKHELEIAPNVYFPIFTGGISDIINISDKYREEGLKGTAEFARGKAAPYLGTGINIVSGTKYGSVPISKRNDSATQKSLGVAKTAIAGLAPKPISMDMIFDYAQDPEANPIGAGMLLTGTVRYTPKRKIDTMK